jgi:putative ABC transport system permease protein
MVVVNDTAARYMGLDNTIGSIINIHGNDHEIVGIAKNFQYRSVIGDIAPLFIIYNPGQTNWCLVKLNPGNPEEGLASLKDIYQTFAPNFPFDYRFLDTYFDEMHASLYNSIYFLYYSAVFAILIACLGLLGLTLFTTSRKVKEIGVRKVNGAHTGNVLALILNQFVRQVLIAFIIASPIAFLLVNKVLQFFTYHVPLGWEVFTLAFLVVMVIVLITVGGQSWRAARRNPVEALRYE